MTLQNTGAERFDVWAPKADSVVLHADGEQYAMVAASGASGWWTAPQAPAGGEVRYGYSLDGGDVVPDPRSRRLPDGVHRLSATFDPAAHVWQDTSWKGRDLQGSVIYELHVGTFTPEGTLDAAVEKLDYLVTLGITTIELLPVNGFNGTHNWGYDGVQWYAVHEGYGGPAGYQRFVDAAHGAGLAVIQDVVYNHLGPSGNYLPMFGPYLKEGDANTWGDSVNLDGAGSDVVREYILDNAAMWLRDYHVDGLRLDAVHALRDERAVHVLEDLAVVGDTVAAETGLVRTLIAESDLNNPKLLYPRGDNGFGLAGQWSDDFHHAVHVAVSGETTGYYGDFESLDTLGKVLRDGFLHDGGWSSFRERHHGRPINKALVHPAALVVCNQNHDQIGNRATGDRLSQSLDYGPLALAAVLTLTSPFTPMLFMGEEFAASTPWQFFTSHPEAELGRLTAEGRIREFEKMGWDPEVVPDPQDPETFLRSKLLWEEVSGGIHARMLALYQDLIRLRKSEVDLANAGFAATDVSLDSAAGWLRFSRGMLEVLLNFSDSDVALPAPGAEILLATGQATGSGESLLLPALSAVVIRKPAA